MKRRVRALVLVALSGAVLTGCSLFEGDDEEEILEGSRISVLDLERKLEPDAGMAGESIQLARPYENASWSQAGGTASHAMYHLALPEDLSPAWSVDIGDAADEDLPILAQPVVADDRVFALDADLTLERDGRAHVGHRHVQHKT